MKARMPKGLEAFTVEIECIEDAKNDLGEGPLWDPEEEILY